MVSTKMFVLAITLFVFMVIVGPFITIWTLNTLFGLTIPYTLATWFAGAWLAILGTGSRTFNNIS